MATIEKNQAWLLLDVVSIVCAIFLICSKNRTNKINGLIKIVIEVIFGIVAFTAARHNADQMYKLTDPDAPSSIVPISAIQKASPPNEKWRA